MQLGPIVEKKEDTPAIPSGERGTDAAARLAYRS
jgi:hypothetical protein